MRKERMEMPPQFLKSLKGRACHNAQGISPAKRKSAKLSLGDLSFSTANILQKGVDAGQAWVQRKAG